MNETKKLLFAVQVTVPADYSPERAVQELVTSVRFGSPVIAFVVRATDPPIPELAQEIASGAVAVPEPSVEEILAALGARLRGEVPGPGRSYP
jgi:hypothetical protein